MFVLRYGDLNEVAIVDDIEKQTGFQMDNDFLTRLVEEKTTFIEFIRTVSGGWPVA